MLRQNVFVHFQTFRRVLLARCSQHLPPPHLSFSFCVLILGTKNGTCLSDGPALPGFQKRTLTYSFFERIDCSGHLKSESAVLWVHRCGPGLRGWSVGWSPQIILAGCSPKKSTPTLKFELNDSYSDVQKTKTKRASRSRFWLPQIRPLEETIEERC